MTITGTHYSIGIDDFPEVADCLERIAKSLAGRRRHKPTTAFNSTGGDMVDIDIVRVARTVNVS